jgi:hypothetical protein
MPRECGASGASGLNGSVNAVSGILDRPLEPVIGLAEGETRWRATTAACVARSCAMNRFGFNFQTTRVRRHSFAISPRISRELWLGISVPSDQRAQGMPGARCARSRAWSVGNTRVSHHGYTGKRPAFPAQWF